MNLVEMKQRKGAVRLADIPSDVLEALNNGLLPTVNLVEWLAMDQRHLMQVALPKSYHSAVATHLDALKSETALACIKAIGQALSEESKRTQDETLFPFLLAHTSDMLRCWAAIMVGLNTQNITLQLEAILPFAIDEHFGVREISWIAIRDQLMVEFDEALPIFTKWVQSENPYQRRFAIESIRPKGVWCKQFKRMSEHPSLALPLLDALQNDPHKYVQDSVANWLNDASKAQPQFVKSVCDQWIMNNPSNKATAYIAKRALRSVI